MSINKLALIRYKTIDQCLQNRYRKWTLDDLVEACSEALYEYEGIKTGVSKRTVQLDLQNMRSEKLGYNAPIIVVDKKYYTYEDKKYSIMNSPLSQSDLDKLSEVVGVLKQFSGFSYFNEMVAMVTKLEDKVNVHRKKAKSYIQLEKNDLLKGLNWIPVLHDAILKKITLAIEYQSFKAKRSANIVVYPYLLKEYRNRWFLLCKNRKNSLIQIYALDRMLNVQTIPNEPYHISEGFEPETYFDDVIGVSKTPEQKPIRIILEMTKPEVNYVLTKPIHPSQTVLKETETSVIFQLTIIWNFEMEREILSFGEVMKIRGPKALQLKMKKRLEKMLGLYKEEEE